MPQEICFSQSEALYTLIRVLTLPQYGISALVSQTSFRRETVCGVMKCQLFSQATAEQASKFKPLLMTIILVLFILLMTVVISMTIMSVG